MSVLKKSQIVILPTNEKVIGTLALVEVENNRDNKALCLVKEFDKAPLGEIFVDKLNNNQHFVGNVISFNHLYILSDEDIQEGDWFLYDTKLYNEFKSAFTSVTIQLRLYPNKDLSEQFVEVYLKDCKKIIATTDSSLTIKAEQAGENAWYNPLPQPSNSFIEKYIERYNNGSPIDAILVEYNDKVCGNGVVILEETLKVNPKDNTITIKSIKDSWNREEVIELITNAFKACYERSNSGYPNTDNHTKLNIDKWVEDNL